MVIAESLDELNAFDHCQWNAGHQLYTFAEPALDFAEESASPHVVNCI